MKTIQELLDAGWVQGMPSWTSAGYYWTKEVYNGVSHSMPRPMLIAQGMCWYGNKLQTVETFLIWPEKIVEPPY